MASELTLNVLAHFAKGLEDEEFVVTGKQITVAGTKCLKYRQTIGTEAEALEIGDMTTPGYFVGLNTDDTNYIEIRDGEEGADVVKLKAGEVALFRLATTTPYAIANTDECELKYMVIED